MKVELVLHDIEKVLLDGGELLQRAAVITSAQMAVRCLELVPHALHVEKVGRPIAILCEERYRALRLVDLVGAEQVARGLGVEVPVGQVEAASLLAECETVFRAPPEAAAASTLL